MRIGYHFIGQNAKFGLFFIVFVSSVLFLHYFVYLSLDDPSDMETKCDCAESYSDCEKSKIPQSDNSQSSDEKEEVLNQESSSLASIPDLDVDAKNVDGQTIDQSQESEEQIAETTGESEENDVDLETNASVDEGSTSEQSEKEVAESVNNNLKSNVDQGADSTSEVDEDQDKKAPDNEPKQRKPEMSKQPRPFKDQSNSKPDGQPSSRPIIKANVTVSSIKERTAKYDTGKIRERQWSRSCKIVRPFSYKMTTDADARMRKKQGMKICMGPSSTKATFKAKSTKKYYRELKEMKWHTDARFTQPRAKLDLLAKINRSSPAVVAAPYLKRLFKEWNDFTKHHGLLYWIAHGGLIGWYWNQELLPWDMDIDVQTDLAEFKSKFWPLNQVKWRKRYLLDVNPNSYTRNFEQGNVIDARFVDTQTGLYVDITVLSLLEETMFSTDWPDSFCSKAKKETVLVCKSPHIYKPTDIFPLKETIFEGIPVYRPNNPIDILTKEYGMKAFNQLSFKDALFDETKNQWVHYS